MRRSLCMIVCVALLFGCGKKGGTSDMTVEDMTTVPDDFSGPLPDLTSPPPDLTSPPPDLTTPRDLANPPDLVASDMTGRPADMTGQNAGDIGTPCTQNGDCGVGPSPTCWKSTVNNQAGAPNTPQGYCSSTCTADADCGGNGTCVPIGNAGKFCLLRCQNARTCRTGYACAYYGNAGVCYSADIFDCDPTANMGACTESGSNKAGGCVRRAYENKGNCTASCTLAAGNCAARNGKNRHCVYYADPGPGPMMAADPYKGLLCFDNPSMPVAAGADCNAVDECVDGYQCDTLDGKCRQLCTKGGGMPTCATGTCADPFMTAATGPGLCR